MQQKKSSLFPFIPVILLAEILLAFLIAVRPRHIFVVLGFLAYALVNIAAVNYTVGHVMLDYTIGSAFANNIFTAVHFLWFADPATMMHHRKQRNNPQRLCFLQRMYLAMCEKGSVRGVGWVNQVPSLPLTPQQSRFTFCVSQILKATMCFLLVDMATAYTVVNPILAHAETLKAPIDAQPHLRCLNILVWMVLPYGYLGLIYSLFGALAVGTGFSEAKYWPSFFGNWCEAYTVRHFWGKMWHQELRRFTSSISAASSRALGFGRGTLSSSLMQVYVAFLISAVLHMAGDAMVGTNHIGRSFPFFFVQAIAITFEALVAQVQFFPFDVRERRRLCGFAWVAIWFTYTVPSFAWQIRLGLFNPSPLPLSPSMLLLRRVEERLSLPLGSYFPTPRQTLD